MAAWTRARFSCSSAPSSPRASSSRSAPRARASRRSWRSSRSGCCSARTARAGSSSTTPSLRAPSASIGLAAILYEGGLSTSWRRLRQVAVPAALLSTVGVAVTAVLTGVGRVRPVRPLLARVRPARRRRRVDRRRRRVRDAALHEHPAAARPHARGGDGRQRPDGDRAHDRPDRVDRGPGLHVSRISRCSWSGSSASASLVGVVLGAAAMWAFSRLPHSIGAFAPGRVGRGRPRSRSASPT